MNIGLKEIGNLQSEDLMLVSQIVTQIYSSE
jgi:hypothetical protein